MARILLIEDNKDILYANKTMLELEGYDVITAQNAENGKKLALRENPELIILDIMLPDGNGLELCRTLKKERDFSIIFLSALGTKADVLEGLRAGGYDYLAKPYLMEELLLRIKAVLRNTEVMLSDDFTYGDIHFKAHASVAEANGKNLLLNTKEYAVLDLLCRTPGRFVSAETLMEKVWNVTDGGVQSVYNCLSGLREKIEETDVMIDFKRKIGYMARIKN